MIGRRKSVTRKIISPFLPKDPAVQGAVGDAAMALNTPSEAFDPARQPIEDDSDVPEGDEDPDAVDKNDPEAARRAKHNKKVAKKEKKLKKELDKIKKKGQSKKGFGPNEFAKLKASGVAGLSMNQIKDSDPLKFMQLQHLMNLESKGICLGFGS